MTKYGAWGEKMMYGKKKIGVIRSTVWIGPEGEVQEALEEGRQRRGPPRAGAGSAAVRDLSGGALGRPALDALPGLG